jgi:hypothetical protein
VRLSPLGTSASVVLLYQPRMIDNDDYGAVGGMRISRGNRSTQRKPAPVPLCPPQIPHDLTWDRTRAPAMGSQRLTARPSFTFTRMLWESVDVTSLILYQASSRPVTFHILLYAPTYVSDSVVLIVCFKHINFIIQMFPHESSKSIMSSIMVWLFWYSILHA